MTDKPVQDRAPSQSEDDQLLDEAAQAAQFDRVREAHRLETTEDYVELIDDLIQAKGEARGVDLAKRMGVTQATVNRTIARLTRDGLASSEPYRSIFLTQQGRQMAQASRKRHAIVLEFLITLGVEPQTAALDAEGLEHHCSPETLQAFERFCASKRQ